jgi:uncharacterized protein (TIGR03435 family)
MISPIALRLGLLKEVDLGFAKTAPMALAFVVGILNTVTVGAQISPPQSGSAPRPKFEVVSVRPCNAKDMPSGRGRGGTGASIDPGRLTLECRTVDDLVHMAYLWFADGKGDSRRGGAAGPVLRRLFNQPLDGSPAWMKADRYTIDAKPATPQTAVMMQGPMLQALLEDRFKLKVRRDIREVPVYALVVGKGGPKLEAARKDSCTLLDFTNGPPPLPGPGQPSPCGSFRPDKSGGVETFGQTLAGLCLQFSVALDRDVVDRTGIADTFDIHLDLTSNDLFPARQDTTGRVGDPAEPTAAADPLSAIMRAVQKLGLRLEPSKVQGGFLVIDHVERPSEN